MTSLSWHDVISLFFFSFPVAARQVTRVEAPHAWFPHMVVKGDCVFFPHMFALASSSSSIHLMLLLSSRFREGMSLECSRACFR